MNNGLPVMLMALACGQSTPEASFRTPNFVVHASNLEIAKMVAQSAEESRKKLAKLWLEAEPTDWSVTCQIYAKVALGGSSGRTDVAFHNGKVLSQIIEIKGPLDRILKGPLPHELTHVLFAHYFGAPAPRWADEGGAILSEDCVQGNKQNGILSKIMAEDRCLSLRRLMNIQEYSSNVSSLYAQGHSLSRFLVMRKSHKVFLDFVRQGATDRWDDAVRSHYGYENVEKLEQAWLSWVNNRPVTGASLASSQLKVPTQSRGRLTP